MIVRSGPYKGINPFSALISAGIVLLFVLVTLGLPERSAGWIDAARTFVTFYFTWWHVVLAGFFLLFLLALAASPYGAIVLR